MITIIQSVRGEKMLERFYFRNFKSFDESAIEVRTLTTIIGTNASGKSNAIEGMRILSEIATGRELSVILDGSKNAESEIRGGSVGCPRIGQDYFTLGCTLQIDSESSLKYEISIKTGARVFVLSESLYKTSGQSESLIFQTEEISDELSDIPVKYDGGKRGQKPKVTCNRSISILAQMQSKMPVNSKTSKENEGYIGLLLDQLAGMLFLDPLPSLMRDYSRISDYELRPKADNLSSVLYELCKDKNYKQELLEVLSGLPENEILDIEFIDTTIGDVMLRLKERYGNTAEFIEAKRLSDGTLRYLAIIASLISEEPGNMVIIEEVDNGIHPSRIQSLIDTISRLNRERKVNIIITTHNPVLLNALSKDELLGVVLCYRSNQGGTSKFQSLPGLDALPRLLAKGNLGDLTVRNELVKSIKTPVSPSTDLSWLEV